MKKIFFSFAALAAIAACAETEVVPLDGTAEIMIKPSTALATKADNGVIEGTAYPTTEEFDVYGYWSADWSTETNPTNYLLASETSGVVFEYKPELNVWAGVVSHYWPKDGSLKFACYSPATSDLAHDYATDTYSKDEFLYTTVAAETYDLLVAPTTAAYTVLTASQPVEVAFEHALSWISFQMIAADGDAATAFEIKEVIVNDVCINADLSADMTENGVISWTEVEDARPFVVFSGTQNPVANEKTFIGTQNQCLVIPQATTTVTVNYTQKQLAGSAELANQSITLPLDLTGAGKWEPGKHYIYTLTFTLDEILIKPTVAGWDTVYQTVQE